MKPTYNMNGVILHEDDLRVVIATGLKTKSANTKTGDMVQVWILHRTLNPLTAVKTGQDEAICGGCPHRGSIQTVPVSRGRGKSKVTELVQKLVGRRCYVQIDKAPSGIFKAYQNGRYRYADASEYSALFGGRLVRFGAYGDPAYIPLAIIQAITAVCRDWTGYTHQWRDTQYSAYSAYVMASADNMRDYADANAAGWRIFRVRPAAGRLLAGEIICPASDEGGRKTTCEKCRLCNGAKFGAADVRKNIVIIDHSAIANSQPLIQIGL